PPPTGGWAFRFGKYLVEFRRSEAAKENAIIFSGDRCGGANTARPANVRVVRLGRTASALQQAAIPFCQKSKLF
ncbi:MAG: hypothetical protein PUB80_07450, partial [Clostridiales bacterium]|nr:hypothetical protein [Clostridiales bacterium]